MDAVKGYDGWMKEGKVILNFDRNGLSAYKHKREIIRSQRNQISFLEQQVSKLENENAEINTKLDQILLLLQGKQ